MIKNIPFISDYTKNIVRYHYLIRRIKKDENKLKKGQKSANGDIIDLETVNKMKNIYDSFTPEFKKDLKIFMMIDDKAKK